MTQTLEQKIEQVRQFMNDLHDCYSGLSVCFGSEMDLFRGASKIKSEVKIMILDHQRGSADDASFIARFTTVDNLIENIPKIKEQLQIKFKGYKNEKSI